MGIPPHRNPIVKEIEFSMRPSTIARMAIPFSAAALLTVSALASPGKKKPAGGAANAALIADGQKFFRSAGCIACHVMGDKGGKTGPELTHVGKTWTADKIFAQARNPKKFKADGVMPA